MDMNMGSSLAIDTAHGVMVVEPLAQVTGLADVNGLPPILRIQLAKDVVGFLVLVLIESGRPVVNVIGVSPIGPASSSNFIRHDCSPY